MKASSRSSDVLGEYRAALHRLVIGKPRIAPKGRRITNDAVAVEAGRSKGSIQKSRMIFKELIAEIRAANAAQTNPKAEARRKFDRAKADAALYREERDAALSREVSLLKELFELKLKLAKLTGETIVPFRHGK